MQTTIKDAVYISNFPLSRNKKVMIEYPILKKSTPIYIGD